MGVFRWLVCPGSSMTKTSTSWSDQGTDPSSPDLGLGLSQRTLPTSFHLILIKTVL